MPVGHSFQDAAESLNAVLRVINFIVDGVGYLRGAINPVIRDSS